MEHESTNEFLFVQILTFHYQTEQYNNDFRLQSILPTIDYIIKNNGSIVLATHIGRPKNNEPELSTNILIPWFKKHGYTIRFVEDFTTIARSPNYTQRDYFN